ncbi:unnamed protein product [Amoebophrya sp. A120]|nr:unnamed protein product [Amoebophrya sp. A120]|eukprot:GSA120T00013725001.1
MSVGNFTVGEEYGQLVHILRTMQSSTDNNARKQAEAAYGAAKKQPDFLVQALVQVIKDGEVDLKDYAAILLRRLFLPDKMLDDKVVFADASNPVKQACTEQLLECFKNPVGQPDTVEKIRRHIGNALVTLADQHVVAANGEGERNEQQWPDLLRVTCELTTVENPDTKVCAMDILTELLPIYPKSMKNLQGQMHQLLEQCFGSESAKVRKTAVLLVLGMVMNFKAKEWKPLQPCLPVIIRVLENLAQLKQNEYLTEALESMTECCEYEAIFFKPEITMLANLLVQIIGARDNLEQTPRSAALEFFITLAEQKPKMCMSQCADFGSYLIKAAMDCMMEVGTIEDDGADWAEIMDDEEDDDDDELFKLGGEVIDRAISALSMKKIGASYFQAIGVYVQNTADWRSPMSALSAVSEGVEYVEKDDHLDQLMDLCLKHTAHSHTRVRAQSWHALSRVFADHREVTDRWHKQYMEATLQGLSDPVLRVQTKNLGAFLYFGEALDPVLMELYAKPLLEKLVEKIKSCEHRGVIEECITSIAVVAGSIEKEFAPFYDHIMPMLKQFIRASKDEKETRLRGKAFECMSLFGVAVGKDRFKNDVTDCMQNMLTQGGQSKSMQDKKNADVLTDYLKDAIERVAGVMEEDMGPFLQVLLFGGGHGSGLMQVLDLAHAANHMTVTDDDEEEDEIIQLQNGQKVKSAYFKEMADAAETVCCLVQNSKKAFLPHVPKVCEGLIKLFSIEDKSLRTSLEGDDVLAKCSEVWAAITSVLARSDANMCQQMIMEYCKLNLKWLQDADDAEEICMLAKGVAEVLSSACPATSLPDDKKKEYGDVKQYLDTTYIQQIYDCCEAKLGYCFQEREKSLLKESEWREGAEGDDVEGERNQLDDMDEHHEANVALSQIIGALMQLNPPYYTENILMRKTDPMLRKFLDKSIISKKLQKKDQEVIISKNKILAYFIACDVCEHLMESGTQSWPAFLNNLFVDLQNVDYEVRHAASYFVYLAARIAGSDESFATQALEKLVQVLKDPAEYGKAAQNKYASVDDIKLAEDNTVAAVFALLAYSPALSQKHQSLWEECILPKLPLKIDTEVGPQVIIKLIELFAAERADVTNNGNPVRVSKVCAAFAESYKVSDSEDMDKKIRLLFSKFPPTFFETTLKQNFTETQWKKLEKLMKDPLSEN